MSLEVLRKQHRTEGVLLFEQHNRPADMIISSLLCLSGSRPLHTLQPSQQYLSPAASAAPYILPAARCQLHLIF